MHTTGVGEERNDRACGAARPARGVRLFLVTAVLSAGVMAAGCSVRSMAIDRIGDALSNGGTSFSTDTDPELVKAAAPFSLKMMEGLLEERPDHRGLRLAAARGFAQYAYAFVQQDADELQDEDGAASASLAVRARLMYLRARDHALRGLAAAHPGFEASLLRTPAEALNEVERGDAPLLYWAAVSWAAAISLSKSDPDLVADLPYVESLIGRALELDEQLDAGAIHAFLISYGPLRTEGNIDSAACAQRHFDRAVALSGGAQAGPYVALAESYMVPAQDEQQFRSLLEQALALDVDARPEWRLANLVMQRRARWLLARTERLFYHSSDTIHEDRRQP